MGCSARARHVAWFGTHAPERFIRLANGQCVFRFSFQDAVRREGKAWPPIITWWLLSGWIQSCELFSNSEWHEFKTYQLLEWAKTPPVSSRSLHNEAKFILIRCLLLPVVCFSRFCTNISSAAWLYDAELCFRTLNFLDITRSKENERKWVKWVQWACHPIRFLWNSFQQVNSRWFKSIDFGHSPVVPVSIFTVNFVSESRPWHPYCCSASRGQHVLCSVPSSGSAKMHKLSARSPHDVYVSYILVLYLVTMFFLILPFARLVATRSISLMLWPCQRERTARLAKKDNGCIWLPNVAQCFHKLRLVWLLV